MTTNSVKTLVSQLSDTNAHVRAAACEDLGVVTAPQESKALIIDRLITSLKDPDFRVQQAAATALGSHGKDAQAAISPLLDLALAADAELRSRCIEACQKIGFTVDSLLSRFDEALTHPDKITAYQFLTLTENLGPQALPLLPKLLQCAKQADGTENFDFMKRWQAVEAIGFIGPQAISAEPELIELLKNPATDKEMIDIVVVTLRAIGVDLEEKYPELGKTDASEDPDQEDALNEFRGLLGIEVIAEKWTQSTLDALIAKWVEAGSVGLEITTPLAGKLDWMRHEEAILMLTQDQDDYGKMLSIILLQKILKTSARARANMVDMLKNDSPIIITKALQALRSIPYFIKAERERVASIARQGPEEAKGEAQKLLRLIDEC